MSGWYFCKGDIHVLPFVKAGVVLCKVPRCVTQKWIHSVVVPLDGAGEIGAELLDVREIYKECTSLRSLKLFRIFEVL